jgi:hypothetical protein
MGNVDYHLCQQGQDIGVFPLEELRRRRQVGELTGAELVWCDGMTQWQPLDSVLNREMTGIVPVPSPISPPKSKRARAVKIGVAFVLGLVVLASFGFVAMKIFQRFQATLRRASAGYERLDRESSALAEASKPVQWTTNTLTVAKVLERGKEFRLRQYLEGYEKCSERNPSYDAEALEAIKKWIDFNFGGEIQTNSSALVLMCDKLAANPACDDPLVLAMTAANAGELHEQGRRLDRAVKGFEHSRYNAYPKLYATVMLARNLIRLNPHSDRVRALDESAIQLLKEALKDDSFRPEDQAEIAEILIHGWGSGFLGRKGEAITSTVKAAGKPFEWLALVIEGRHQINEAWKARGSGYADAVTPKGWKGFREHLALARRTLPKAWQLRPDLAEAPYQMMNVSLGDSGISEMRLWFDRTVTAQIDHVGAWNELRWGLRPRWNGDLDSMLAFGVMAANTRRYDTDVPYYLFKSISDLEQELKLPPGHHIYGREDIWPHMQQMCEGYIAEPSGAKGRDSWRSAYSIAAFLAGKYDIARAQLEAINWQPWRGNMLSWGMDMTIMPLEVAARTSPAGQQIDAAESRRDHGDFAGALQLYRELSTATNTDERTQAFIRDRLVTVGMEQRLKTGEWIDFLPTGENLTGWTVWRGKCAALPDGALEVQSDQTGHIIFPRARVGTDFEVRGTFEVVRSSTAAFEAGLVVGAPPFESSGWCSFRMKRNADEGDVASFAEGWSTRQLCTPVTLNNVTNTFYFRFQHGLVSSTVNDKEVFKNAEPPKYTSLPTSESHLGLGAFNAKNDTVIRYHNVQVRSIPEVETK